MKRYTIAQLRKLAREYGRLCEPAVDFLSWVEFRESPKPSPIVKPLLRVRGKKDA